jgi:hypothetical protein
MFVIVRDVVRHANLNETINYKISLHLSIQGCLALTEFRVKPPRIQFELYDNCGKRVYWIGSRNAVQ